MGSDCILFTSIKDFIFMPVDKVTGNWKRLMIQTDVFLFDVILLTSCDVDVISCVFVYITLDKSQCKLKRCVNK